MSAWLSTSFKLLTGHAGPRDLPASVPVLLAAAALYAVASMADAALVLGGEHAVGFGFADLAFTGAYTALCLAIRRRSFRLQQTLLAMLACGAWLTLPSLAVHWVIGPGAAGETGQSLPLAADLCLAAVTVWSVIVVARIVRDALDVDFFTGITVSMTYTVIGYFVLVAVPAWLRH